MLRFFTFLYASLYIRSERQWGEATDHSWQSLMGTSLILFLNAGTCFILIDAVSPCRIPLSTLSVLAALVIVTCLIWLTIQRSGRGIRLINQLKNESTGARKRAESIVVTYLIASVLAVVIPMIVLAVAAKHTKLHRRECAAGGPISAFIAPPKTGVPYREFYASHMHALREAIGTWAVDETERT